MSKFSLGRVLRTPYRLLHLALGRRSFGCTLSIFRAILEQLKFLLKTLPWDNINRDKIVSVRQVLTHSFVWVFVLFYSSFFFFFQ